MEFLLINHPLDCPICDQGGECELQDLAVGFGRDISRFVERKRVVKDKNLGPLVSTDMTRCIHCTRCVRFGQDIAGIQEMGATGRGEHMEIGTYIERSVDHELSGNIIDLCPVGALNSKPFRYRGRGWEMTQYPLISPHDGMGTQLFGHVLRGRLMRVVPRACEEINETWIADRDRFSYEGIYSDDRLLSPQVRQADGSWREVPWDRRSRRPRACSRRPQHSPRASEYWRIPPARSRSCTCWRGWPRVWAAPTSIIACGSGISGTRPPTSCVRRSGTAIAAIDQLDALLVVGSNLRHEVPMLAHRVRKAALQGRQSQLHQSGRVQVPVSGGAVPGRARAGRRRALAAVLRAALGDAPAPAAVSTLLEAAAVEASTPRHRRRRSRPVRTARSGWARWRCAARTTASCARWRVRWPWRPALRSANSPRAATPPVPILRACCRIGGRRASRALRPAPMRAQMLERPLAGYLLLNSEPWADSAQAAALETLARARSVVAVTPYASDEMRRVAHVLLPAGTFAETSGTYVSLEGRWQSQSGVARALGASRPAWKILRVLGNLLELSGFDYQSSEQVRDELAGAAVRGRQLRNRHSAGRRPLGQRRHRASDRSAACTRSIRYCGVRHRCAARPMGAWSARVLWSGLVKQLTQAWQSWLSLPAYVHSSAVTVILTVVLILSVAYLTLWERKLIGWMQMRIGPNRVKHLRLRWRLRPALRRRLQAADQGSGGADARQQGAVRAWRRPSR